MERKNYKVLLFVFSCVLICLFAFVGCSERVTEETISSDSGSLYITMGEANGISLAFAPSNAGTTGSDGYTKTLIATVSPSTAADKSVDWEVLWSQSQLDHTSRTSESVTDYITVTPLSDGSTTATVECHKAFSGDDVWVICRSRIGGFTATCTVTFRGYPSDFSVDTTGKTVETDSTWNASMAKLSYGVEYSFDLLATNKVSSVDSSLLDYVGFYNIVYSGSRPGAVVTITIYDSTGAVTSEYDETVYFSGIDETDSGIVKKGYQLSFENLVFKYLFWISDNKLYCKASGDPTSVSNRVVTGSASGRREVSFKQFIDDKVPYYVASLSEGTSGASHVFNMQFVTTVNAVSLNAASLVF